jgi:hypothetical protein
VLASGGLLHVLGAGRRGVSRDVPAGVRDVLTREVLSRRSVAWEPPSTEPVPA